MTQPGDDNPVRTAIDRYERPLVAYTMRIVGRVDVAREVVQETFLTFCNHREAQNLNGEMGAWLYTVCRNKALDVRRKEGRMTQLDDATATAFVSELPTPAETVEAADSASGILKQLAKLPPAQQEVIRLKFQHGLTYREIATVTKLSESNVGFLISTGLKTIRLAMSQ